MLEEIDDVEVSRQPLRQRNMHDHCLAVARKTVSSKALGGADADFRKVNASDPADQRRVEDACVALDIARESRVDGGHPRQDDHGETVVGIVVAQGGKRGFVVDLDIDRGGIVGDVGHQDMSLIGDTAVSGDEVGRDAAEKQHRAPEKQPESRAEQAQGCGPPPEAAMPDRRRGRVQARAKA